MKKPTPKKKQVETKKKKEESLKINTSFLKAIKALTKPKKQK